MSTWGRSSVNSTGDEPGEPRLERVSGRPIGWRLVSAGLALVLIIGALWLKPWEGTGPPPLVAPATGSVASPPPSAAPMPEPTTDPVALAAGRRQCQSPSDWRIVTVESTATRNTRTMYAASPIASLGPPDTGLELSRLYAGGLSALGVCVPRSDGQDITAELASVTLWQVTANGELRPVLHPVVLDEALYRAGEAYWGPPAGEGSLWPPGRYLFQIRAARGFSSWMGVEFVAVGRAQTGRGPARAALRRSQRSVSA